MLRNLKIRNGNIIISKIVGDPYDIDFKQYTDNEDLLKIEYGEYIIVVKNQKNRMSQVQILKEEENHKPIVKQEVGDFESLQFTLQNYIDLLDSFNGTYNKKHIK